ncbi:hypothetical protein RB195_004023 [Necator americanus]|uniref:Uncharacterized protein n=1 Tax=Necator americanus TaxID=51031 RepID=A0ABR1BJJ6_NECAM
MVNSLNGTGLWTTSFPLTAERVVNSNRCPALVLCVPFAASKHADRFVISIENYNIYCDDADEKKVGGCVIAVKNKYNNPEEFDSSSPRCTFVGMWDPRERKLWIVSDNAPTETAENNSKDPFFMMN